MPQTTKAQDKAQEIAHNLQRSRDWLKSNFYPEWRQVHESYKCEREPYRDPNKVTDVAILDQYGQRVNREWDDSRTSIGMPDTYALVNRGTARMTAQLPNLRYKSRDKDLSEKISRGLMYQWDKGDIQRWQPMHVKQARLFGWSVKAWYWEPGVQQRFRRVSPLEGSIADQQVIQSVYEKQISTYIQQGIVINEETGEPDPELIAARLLADHGRGGLLPVRYNYQAYTGPMSDVLFVGNCFPEPNFRSIQKSNWFCVVRRRNKKWLENLSEMYGEENPELANNIQELLRDKPKGTAKGHDRDVDQLFRDMQADIGRSDSDTGTAKYESDASWAITECHYPGEDSRIAYSCDSHFIGEVRYPYELDGKIAFTELIFLDDLLCGVGDSHARIMRGIQQLHDRQRGQQSDLIWNLLRPLIWTTSRKLYDNPEAMKRHKGMRLVLVDGPNEFGMAGEQAALAAAAGGLQDESAILRAWQMGSGESNLSMASNVDPQQARTATGARLMAFNQDILARADLMMLNYSVRDDATMMYQLNRSESSEPIVFDSAPYIRTYDATVPFPDKEEVTIRPLDWQIDGEIEPEVGSTIADDDDARIHASQNLWSFAMSNPRAINVNKAAERVLVSMGEGKHLNEWVPEPPPPPAAEPPRPSVSVSIKWEDLTEEMKRVIMDEAGFKLEPEKPPEMQDAGDIGARQPGQLGPNGQPPVDAAALAAQGALS